MSDLVERLRVGICYQQCRVKDTASGCECAEAAETIESLRAELAKVNMEVDRLTRTNQAKREHRDKLLEAGVKAAARIEQLEAAVNSAYNERNRLVALLARLFPSGVKRTAIPGWDEAWHGCVYIDLPTGQASWHYHDREAHLFEGLPPYSGEWDGHSTDEKYERIARAALGEKP